jgi:hypothetical protein
MPLSRPIKLTIYDPETAEPVKDVMTAIVPWGLMKRAVQLMKALPAGYESMSEAELIQHLDEGFVDALTCFAVDLFGGRATVEEINRGVELSEMLPLLTAAGFRSFANPTKPGPK